MIKEHLSRLDQQVDALSLVLEKEFTALSNRDFDTLEALQTEKVALLSDIESLMSAAFQEANSDQAGALDTISSRLEACKEAHIRNDLVLKRQVEVTQNILTTLVGQSSSSTNVYTKLGRIKPNR